MTEQTGARGMGEEEKERATRAAATMNSDFVSSDKTRQQTHAQDTPAPQIAARKGTAHMQDGTKREVNCGSMSKQTSEDICTSEELGGPLTQEDIANKMEKFNRNALAFTGAEEARRKYPGGKVLGGKLVMHNKGDADPPPPTWRRYVATEINQGHDTT